MVRNQNIKYILLVLVGVKTMVLILDFCHKTSSSFQCLTQCLFTLGLRRSAQIITFLNMFLVISWTNFQILDHSFRPWPGFFCSVYFIIILFSVSDFLLLLCLWVGLQVVVQRHPAIVLSCAVGPSCCCCLRYPVCMSGEYLPIFQGAVQAFPSLGIMFNPYQTSIKWHGIYWILCSYSIVVLST